MPTSCQLSGPFSPRRGRHSVASGVSPWNRRQNPTVSAPAGWRHTCNRQIMSCSHTPRTSQRPYLFPHSCTATLRGLDFCSSPETHGLTPEAMMVSSPAGILIRISAYDSGLWQRSGERLARRQPAVPVPAAEARRTLPPEGGAPAQISAFRSTFLTCHVLRIT